MFSKETVERPVIYLKNLSKKYTVYDNPSHKLLEMLALYKRKMPRENWALRDIDLEVSQGTTLGILGENGSGKSTLLQIVAGILRQTSGHCHIRGNVAVLLELGSGFNPEFSGRENVFMSGAIMGFTRSDIESRMEDILNFAEIGDFIEQPVKNYSSGMFMRLAFSVAIHVDPDILLVDEVLAVGDLIFQHRCASRMRQLRERGKTILFVTHDLQAITRFCDRAILLDNGRKLEDGEPAQVVQKYRAMVFERERREIGNGEKWVDIEQDSGLKIVDSIPHVDHRYGDQGAKIIGVTLHSMSGNMVNEIRAHEEVQLVLSVRFHRHLDSPIIGFTIRDRLGVEICASNTAYEGVNLPSGKPNDVFTVGFRIQVPPMRPDSYSISPAVANGNILDHTIEDWIDNAYIVSLADSGLVYGMMRWPVKATFKIGE